MDIIKEISDEQKECFELICDFVKEKIEINIISEVVIIT